MTAETEDWGFLELLRDADPDGRPVQVVDFCEPHEGLIRMELIQRGFGDHLDLAPEERAARILAGDPDAMTELMQNLTVGVLSVFGPAAVAQSGGYPLCTLDGTLVRAADEMACRRRRSN